MCAVSVLLCPGRELKEHKMKGSNDESPVYLEVHCKYPNVIPA
jgi:hypothetical protein